MIGLNFQQNISQTIDLLLSPRLLQMLKVLQLPYAEFIEQLNKEAEENPVLEVERCDEYVEFLRYLTSDKSIRKEADFSELAGLENFSRVAKTLEDHLLEQLEFEDLEPQQKQLCRELIGNIDDHGYLLAYPRLRDRLMEQFKVSRPTVDKALSLVQQFEPDGVGARDLKECLLLQIRAYDFDSEELAELLERAVGSQLEALERQDYKGAAEALGIAENGAKEIAEFIKNNLHPYPGAKFGGEAKMVIPSFAVEPAGRGYKFVNLETRYGPSLKLSAAYLKMLDDPKTDAKTRAFLTEKLRRARELMEDFAKRSETLEKIVRKIIGTQADFLARGALWLKPLSQKSLAGEFGLHPSTISRSVAEKYIQTPQGLFPLKFLCPRGPKGLTAARLKALIVGLIGEEDKSRPLSDAELSRRLKEKGADLDRRTVAYYRKELKIATAAERGEHEQPSQDPGR
ncbi:MAG: RNA polymerase factor sigma-54 [Candidatus Saganbacteria bacterium]|nr:RNA polymerase factor sigma-54 [Candidatus Saganbacteria bacterium]